MMRVNMKKKGFILITSMIASCILIAMALPYVSRVATEYRITSKMMSSTAAIDIAEAGVDRAIWEIAYNGSAFSGWTYATPSGYKTWTISNVPFSNFSGTTMGYYDVLVSLPNGSTTDTITATAYVPTKASPAETKKVVVVYAGGQYHFTNAIAAAGNNPSITMSGQAFTDSYNSTIGPYGSPLQTVTNQGNIQTNGPITLSGQAYVNGNANPGPNYPFSGTPPVSGSYATLSAPITVSPVVIPPGPYNNNNIVIVNNKGEETPYNGGSSLSYNGSDPLKIPGGTYYFDSINITGNAQVIVTGPSIIYVGGNVLISGKGVINGTANNSPANLGIYATGNDINLSGQSAYYGTVYAPNATVTLTGQTDLYGAIVCGSSVDAGQASIHYDLALANATTAPANYRATSWMEQ